MRVQLTVRAIAAVASLVTSLTAGAGQIIIGQVAPLSGLEATQARAYSEGIRLAFAKANKAGGIHGHTFTLVRKDDRGRPEETISATRALLTENRPLALAGYFGDSSLEEVVNSGLLQKENIPIVGYRINGIRPEVALVYNVRANLSDELNKIAGYLTTVGISRFGLFYPDGAGANSLLATVTEVMKAQGGTLTAKATYVQGTNKVPKSVIDGFIASAPQAIIMLTSGAAAAAFIEQYRLDGGTAQLFAHSGVDFETISQRLGEEQTKALAITQVTPSPYKISNRLSKEFTDLVRTATPQLEVPVSYAMMEGYIAGNVVVETARRMGPNISRAGFIAALDGLDNFDLGGYRVGFRPGMRSGSKFVELTIITETGRVRH